jgi:hypothetical protein
MYNIVEWPDGRESQNEGWLHYLKQMRSMHIDSGWDLQLATAACRNQLKATVKAKLTGNPFEVEQVLESSQSPTSRCAHRKTGASYDHLLYRSPSNL